MSRERGDVRRGEGGWTDGDIRDLSFHITRQCRDDLFHQFLQDCLSETYERWLGGLEARGSTYQSLLDDHDIRLLALDNLLGVDDDIVTPAVVALLAAQRATKEGSWVPRIRGKGDGFAVDVDCGDVSKCRGVLSGEKPHHLYGSREMGPGGLAKIPARLQGSM